MILADKIIEQRKKKGWSQEELAERMDVSRQAVSKWEMAQSTPDLDKILQMSELFGVTTDYLLKDEIEDAVYADTAEEPVARRVTTGEARDFLEHRQWASNKIALATYLCILSVIPLLLLGAASEVPAWGIPETLVGVLGIVILLGIVAVAVGIFIHCGLCGEPYEYLDGGVRFELERGLRNEIQERQKEYRPSYIRTNVIAACVCILSPIPLIVGAFTDREFIQVILLTVTLAVAGVGVWLFILAGVRWAAYQKLLREGEYADAPEPKNKTVDRIESIFWAVLLAAYLGWSFLTGDWHITWVVFPVGAVLSAVISIVYDIVRGKRK